jgi:hypothetical protein
VRREVDRKRQRHQGTIEAGIPLANQRDRSGSGGLRRTNPGEVVLDETTADVREIHRGQQQDPGDRQPLHCSSSLSHPVDLTKLCSRPLKL